MKIPNQYESLFSSAVSSKESSNPNNDNNFFNQLQNHNNNSTTEASSVFTGTTVSNEINYMFVKEQEAIIGRVASAGYKNNNVNQLKEDYTAILEKAVHENAYNDPKAFMKSLSVEERKAIQTMHSYGLELTNYEIDSMSFEGSYNMLVPGHMQQDFDKNGLTASGNAQIFKFPSSNAPDNVKEAWAEMTAGMTSEERLMAEAKMMTHHFSANFDIFRTGGSFDDYVDPFLADDFSYMGWAQKGYDANEYFKGSISNEQYEADKKFYTRFMEIFSKYGIA